MKNDMLLPLLALASLSPAHTQAKQPDKKLNLVFIVTDEHNFHTLGCYRNLLPPEQAEVWGAGNVVETPNIDRIARNGVLFNRMYASAPVSTPARASMFTGMYGAELGIPNNSTKAHDGKYLHADVTTIAQCLSKAGYVTGYAGKLHLAECPEDKKQEKEWWRPYPVGHEGYNYGFKDNTYMFNGGHGKYIGFTPDNKPYFASPRSVAIGKDKYGQTLFKDERSENVKGTTDWLTDRALEFIDANKNKPFYYVLSIPDPHTPDVAIKPYDKQYAGNDFKFPKTYSDVELEGMPAWQQPDGKAKVLMKALPQYFGMVKDIDDNVGRVLKKLEEDGILENTIIVFASDHGDLMGEHGRMNKGTLHESSAKVPFVIAQGQSGKNPVVPRGKVVSLAANTTDWMPTFLALLGVDCPKVSGRSLTPVMNGDKPDGWVDVTFSQLGFVAAIDSRYKLRISPYKEETWLLDDKEDPYEMTNYINDAKHKDVAKRLALKIREFNIKHNKSDKRVEAKIQEILNM